MRINYFGVILLAGAFAGTGCHSNQKAQTDAVRDGIRQYLTSLNTLDLGAMDMNVSNVKIDGNQAQADVLYTPKGGGAPGAGMRVSYSLEKKGEQWVVVKKNAMGGTMDHPTGATNPRTPPGAVHGNMPNFKDILPPAPADTSAANGTLPPGHPPVPATEYQKPD